MIKFSVYSSSQYKSSPFKKKNNKVDKFSAIRSKVNIITEDVPMD